MKNTLIKSPLNYVGGKFKLLPQILPLFPKNINTFVDLFCGGLNVGINVEADTIIANDICKPVIEVYLGLINNGAEKSLQKVKKQINKYDLSKTNEEGFKAIREYYNKENRSWEVFYAMLTHSFNYQIRFNKNNEYNMPFGKNRSSFNPTLEKNFIRFAQAIEEKNIICCNRNFTELDINKLTNEDFVYIDPPYLISCASYNEQDGWNERKERELLELCDNLHTNGIKFALSNVLEHKGMKNDILIEWSKKYKVNYLNFDYNNCNYHKDDNKAKTIEVLIINY